MSNKLANASASTITTTPPLSAKSECTDYVICQQAMIQSIDEFNTAYMEYLAAPNDESLQSASQTAADNMLKAVQNVTAFITENPEIVVTPPKGKHSGTSLYADVLDKRQHLMNQVDVLKSMNGAPKEYNQPNNIYDEYRISYDSAVYVGILVSIVAVFVIFLYFRSI